MAKKEEYLFPTRYGSHSSMIDEEKTSLLVDESMVILVDECGPYATERKLLDNKMADSYRMAGTVWREWKMKSLEKRAKPFYKPRPVEATETTITHEEGHKDFANCNVQEAK